MLIIDRFESEFAIVENTETEKMTMIERNLIENNASEGDVIMLSDGIYCVDSEATKKRRAEVLALLKKLNLDTPPKFV